MRVNPALYCQVKLSGRKRGCQPSLLPAALTSICKIRQGILKQLHDIWVSSVRVYRLTHHPQFESLQAGSSTYCPRTLGMLEALSQGREASIRQIAVEKRRLCFISHPGGTSISPWRCEWVTNYDVCSKSQSRSAEQPGALSYRVLAFN